MSRLTVPLRVLYVVGAGRSGSTMLTIVLNDHPDIIGAGELGYLSKSGHAFAETCSCGARATKCELWSRVYEEWLRIGGPESIEDYVALQRRFEQGRLRPVESVPSDGRESASYLRYASLAKNLLEAICRVSGKTVIVDSTKTPWRALMLASFEGIEVRVLHLVRHPAGVVWSMKKGLRLTGRPPRRVVGSCVFWLILNLQAAFVRRRLPASHSLRIRYEDFVRTPAETMSRIERLVGRDLGAVGRRAASGGAFSVKHTIAGNRLRMKSTVRLRMDRDWEDHLSRFDRLICWTLTGWLARLYGYTNLLGRS